MSVNEPPTPDADFRWQAWMQHSPEGVFLLNRRRRLVFANRAWERATGLLFKEVRGRPCRRRPRTMLASKEESILSALAPPPEAWKGNPCQARRPLPGIGRENQWMDLAYLPLGKGDELLGILGVIKERLEAPPAASLPLPETWLALRDRAPLGLDAWDANNAALSRLLEQVRLAANQPGLGVLFVGARGTGKLRLARTLHRLSPWKQRFFACLECDRLPARAVAETLFPSAYDPSPLGVILLKQPSALPLDLQAQLVQYLENREEPLPWVMASLREEPEEEVRAGRLSAALLYRLSTLVLRLPPLRERKGELPEMCRRFLQGFPALLETSPKGISPEALEMLRAHDWPDNLHGLSRVLLSAAQRTAGERLEPDHLPMYLRTRNVAPERTFKLDEILETVERRMIELALCLSGGNKKKASDLLGIWRPRLLRRMEALKIEGAAEEE